MIPSRNLRLTRLAVLLVVAAVVEILVVSLVAEGVGLEAG